MDRQMPEPVRRLAAEWCAHPDEMGPLDEVVEREARARVLAAGRYAAAATSADVPLGDVIAGTRRLLQAADDILRLHPGTHPPETAGE